MSARTVSGNGEEHSFTDASHGTSHDCHSYCIRPPSDNYEGDLCEKLLNCAEAAKLYHSSEQQLFDCGIVSSANTSLPAMEKMLLDMTAYGCTDGVFYCLALQLNDKIVVRFLESGCFRGLMKYKYISHLSSVAGLDFSRIFTMRLYSSQDISERTKILQERRQSLASSRRTGAIAASRNRSGETYHRLLNGRSGATVTVRTCAENVKLKLMAASDSIRVIDFTLHTIKRNVRQASGSDRFSYMYNTDPDHLQAVHKIFTDYVVNGATPPADLALVNYLSSVPCCGLNDIRHQFEVLSMLSNNHWRNFVTVFGGHSSASTANHLNLVCHMSFTDKRGSLPASPRNRFMYFLANGNMFQAHRAADEMLRSSNVTADSASNEMSEDSLADDNSSCPNPPKRARKVVMLTGEMFSKEIAENLYPSAARNSYQDFRERVLMEGSLFWRYHSEEEDVFVLNDYCPETGGFLPFSFVHVGRLENGGSVLYTCSCRMYNWLQQKVMSASASDDTIVVAGITCMHCRFLKEEFEPKRIYLRDNTLTGNTPVNSKLLQSVSSLNHGAVLLSPPSSATYKFSVRSKSGTGLPCSFVHLSSSCSFIYCLSGECRAHRGCKKKIQHLVTDNNSNQTDVLCEHLEMMRANVDTWKHLIPSVEQPNDLETDTGVNIENREDSGLTAAPAEYEPSPRKSYFDVNRGAWDFGGLSLHKPRPSFLDPKLSSSARQRAKFHDDETLQRSRDGYLKGPDLVPIIPQSCPCQAGYISDNSECHKMLDYITTVFALHVPLQCSVYYVDCLARNPCCRLLYSGEQDCLHFWTHNTAAGDEIGWDFVNRIQHSKISFTAFCDDMSRKYKLFDINSASFMSRSTFVSWFFSWAARMNIDFRQHRDPWCGRCPPVVAGDSTHVGLTLRNLNIVPIEQPSTDARPKQSSHRRYDRVFLSYRTDVDNTAVRSARTTLLRLCKQALSEDRLAPVVDDDAAVNLIHVLPDHDAVKTVINNLLDHGYPQVVHESLARFVKLLACDAPVSALLPFRYLSEIRAALDSVRCTNADNREKLLNEISSFCPELADLLKKSLICGVISSIADFVSDIHSSDDETSSVEPVLNSYNPESGVAYYFTDSGYIVRNVQDYAVSDETVVTCRKQYPVLSYGGFSHTFLWFCPMHGHCYGFHLISGAEGRKDPFASLVKYAPVAPKEIFYDFACGLSEYALNREPKFFSNSRFWHDVFHGYSHKCAASFRSTRITTLLSVNSEICEQFNAYIQCVKYTASHLSQSHFTFFLQFFIYLWNTKKTETFSQYARYVLEDMN